MTALEAAYRKSKDTKSDPDYGCLVHAIGKWVSLGSPPTAAPTWALIECEHIYQENQRRVRTPSKSGPREGRNDAAILELVADLYVDAEQRERCGVKVDRSGKFSDEQLFVAAIRTLGEADRDGHVTSSQTRKVRRAWNVDSARRIERARARWLIKFEESTGFRAGPSRPYPDI